MELHDDCGSVQIVLADGQREKECCGAVTDQRDRFPGADCGTQRKPRLERIELSLVIPDRGGASKRGNSEKVHVESLNRILPPAVALRLTD